MAHCATDGEDRDLETPGRPEVPSLTLCQRLLADERYRGRAFADLAAVTLVNRMPDALAGVLAREDLFPRLVNGSDYPVPGIHAALRTGPLARHGFLDADEAVALREIYHYNPLLYDYVVKRTIRHPETGARLPAAVFGPRPALP
jgi:mannonate dehydratase